MDWTAVEARRIKSERKRREWRKHVAESIVAAFVIAWGVVIASLVFGSGCSRPGVSDPANDPRVADAYWAEQLPGGDCPPGSISSVRVIGSDALIVSARSRDPQTGAFESRALELDGRLPEGVDVLGVEFGWPVSTWYRTAWRQYRHPETGESRIVLAAMLGAGPDAGIPIEAGQRFVFARLSLVGYGVPAWEHLVDGFEGYTLCDPAHP